MPNPRDSYLLQLERLAFRYGVSEDVCRALIVEIATHLDATIQARVETGERMDVAVGNAVKSFGNPKLIVAKLAQVHQPKYPRIYRPFLLSALSLFGIYLFVFLGPGGFWGNTLLLSLTLGLIWFCVESFRGKRLQVWSLAVMAVPMWIALALVLSSQWVTTYGFAASFKRDGLPETVQQLTKSVAVNQAYAANLEVALDDYKRNGGLRLPRDFDKDTGAIVWRTAPNSDFAKRSWKLIEQEIPRQKELILESQRSAEDAIAAQTRPWFYEAPNELGVSASFVLQLLAFMLALNGIVVFIRWFVEEIVRSIRTRNQRSTLSSVLPSAMFHADPVWARLVSHPVKASTTDETVEQTHE